MPPLDFWESKVLKSLDPVVKSSTLIKVNEAKIAEVASWMAYEEFGKPDGSSLFNFGDNPDFLMDLTLTVNTMNFAFTNFDTGVKYETDYNGRRYSDSEAMMANLHRAVAEGIPFFDGTYQANMVRADLEQVFQGTIEMPMLDERVKIFNEVGEVLVAKYEGKWHNFVRSCAPRLYADGNGILERLTTEFPRFADVSEYHGSAIQLYKLPQLGIWGLHLALMPRKAWALEDAHLLTAFADYIVPVGLRVMGIFEYASELEAQINSLIEVPRDSAAEVEIRANSIYAIARLTEEINARRVGLEPLLMPQVDFRLWKAYHATHWPHHLTRTVMY
jgi:hypothetical protein